MLGLLAILAGAAIGLILSLALIKQFKNAVEKACEEIKEEYRNRN